LAVLAHTEYEADDLIGSALHRARPAGFRGVIVSADKDLSQLLGEHDEQWDFARGQRWGAAGVKARHGVHAHQIADYLALTGDAVDNIPGVGGIGAKTAAVLLSHFGSLDALLERVDEVAFLRLRGAAQVAARLREQRELALLFRQLTTIACDAPLDYAVPATPRGAADPEMLDGLATALRFGPMTRRRLRIAAGLEEPAPAWSDGAPARARPTRGRRRLRIGRMDTTDKDAPRVVYEGRYQRMVVRGTWEYSERTHAGGLAAIILAVTPEDRILFVEQFRVPLQARTIEMPAGLVGDIDAGESIEASAIRELEEETGWTAERAEVLMIGPTSSGASSEKVAFVRATGL